jgi:uncharacterized protein (TIGR03083 family)
MEQADPIELIAREQQRLAQEWSDLPPQVWNAASRCEGWTNARVAAHLTSSAEWYRDSVIRALNGDSAAPVEADGRRLTPEQFQVQSRLSQEALAQRSPVELIDHFTRSGADLVGAFRRATAEDFRKPAWHRMGTLSIEGFVGFRVYELALHGWDVRATVDPRAAVRAELCPFLIRLVRQVQPRFCHPDPRLEGVCRIMVNGEAWSVEVRDGSVRETSGTPAANVTIDTDASTFLLVVTERRSLDEVASTVTIGSDEQPHRQLLGALCFRV